MGWFERLDAAGRRWDAQWLKWLDRTLSPAFDLCFAWLPLWFLMAVLLLALMTAG